jgi:transposase
MYGERIWMDAKRLRAQGMSYVEIGELLGIDRRTAKKLCEEKEPPRARRRGRSSKLDPFKMIIDSWLEMRPKMRSTIIYERLKPLGYEGGYTIVKDYVRSRREELARMATVRFETLPGFQAQADFGKVKVSFLSGTCPVILLVYLLGFSRWRKTMVASDETRQSLMAGLSEAFFSAGGVPQEILLDNQRTVVTKPRRRGEDAVIADEWLRFCAHYGTSTRACWPYRAQTKGKVERPIGEVKAFLYAHTFLDLEHLEDELSRSDDLYNNRIHSATGMTPEERLKIERTYLLPLPGEPFACAMSYRRYVSRDCFVSFDGNLYSAPAAFAGREVRLRITQGEVMIYSPQGALLASYARRPKGRGARILNPDHWQGVPGAGRALEALAKLEQMGLSPYVVEKRDLSVYEEAIHGDRR